MDLGHLGPAALCVLEIEKRPLGSWNLERSVVPGTVIVTLRTDGFSVSVGVPALELLRMWTQSASTSTEAGGIIAN